MEKNQENQTKCEEHASGSDQGIAEMLSKCFLQGRQAKISCLVGFSR